MSGRRPSANDGARLGLDIAITRRDFVNGSLMAAGAVAVTTPGGAQDLDEHWTGPGGIGDYRRSNGNTHAVVNAAHAVRDGRFDQPVPDAEQDRTLYDLVIVGAGLTGLMCAWDFQRRYGTGRRCLILDNHDIFGGEAKGNVLMVDGHRLEPPQGSNAFAVPHSGFFREFWDDIGVPTDYEFQELTGAQPGLAVPRDHYGPMLYTAEKASLGYWFRGEGGGGGMWRRDIWRNDLAEAPWPADLKSELLRWRRTERVELPAGVAPLPEPSDILRWRQATEQGGLAKWLDTMSYADYLEKVMKLSPRVSRFIDPLVAVGLSGTASDAVSAYAAQRVFLPGVAPHALSQLYERSNIMTAPLGNGFMARYLVKKLLPAAIAAGRSLHDVVRHPVDLGALDRPGAAMAIRLRSLAVRVEHEGRVDGAEAAMVTYLRDGRAHRVRARRVTMAGGSWINRRVLRDAPDPLREALATFCHGPVLCANVALRHWKFMDRLGIAGAQWFDGFGFHAGFTHPMRLGRDDAPFDPRRPVALTLYVPFLTPGLPAAAQCQTGRARLLGAGYRELERQIRGQLTELFGAHGFNPRRDIAAIVTNRWGHAYVCPQPGYFFGRDGRPPPRDVVRAGYGRIAFAHAELQGNQSMLSSALEAKRASEQTAAALG